MAKATTNEDSKPVRLADILMANGLKQFGADSVSLRGLSEIDYWLDTRCFALNTAIGREGGLPSGRLTIIEGKESVGKSALCYQIMAGCQSRGGLCIYLECESAFEADRAAALGLYNDDYVQELGLNVEPLVILKPQHILEAFSMIEFFIENARKVDSKREIVVVWDSVAATPTTAEASDDNSDYGAIQPGLAARQVSMGFRRLTHKINKYQVVMICTNFIKEKINSGGFGGWGDNTATIAQKPLGQHASLRINLVRTGDIGGKGATSQGLRVKATLTKNKLAPPKRVAEFDFWYKTGTDNDSSMLDMAKHYGIVKQAGAYINFEGVNFKRAEFTKFEHYADIVGALKERVRQEQTNALGDWKPDEDEDNDGDSTDESA